mmetsp:Transcript_42376/g.67934  ORF Transcript_42376/g.67934 Transcript_42376/m.67934 type:complete len:329 (-) Transcript_42376:10663-11649(-)
MFGGFGTTIFLNSVVVYPGTTYILKSHKRIPSLNKRKILAVLFLSLVGLCGIGLDLADILQERNLFKILQVSRASDDREIRVSYQRLAKEYHPDRNRENPNAEKRFVEMKDAYDVLANKKLRDTYDKWGYEGLGWEEKDSDVLFQGLLQNALKYVMWFAITILLTVTASRTHARSIALAGLSLIMAIDIHLKTSTSLWYIPFFSHLAVYQITHLLFTIYPTYIAGVIVFQNLTHFDASDRNHHLMLAIMQRQNLLVEHFSKLEHELRLLSKTGGITSGTAHIPTAASAANASLPRHLAAKNQQQAAGAPQKKRWYSFMGVHDRFLCSI